MKIIYGIFLLVIAFIKFGKGSNFQNRKFFFEYNNINFNAEIIEKEMTKELLKQVPIENKEIYISNFEIHINLDDPLTPVGENLYSLKKGDIYTDGINLFIYTGDSEQIIDLKTFYLIGSLATIDRLLIFLKDKPNNALNFRALCESSVFDTYTNGTYISEDNPSFFIFNKDSVDFDEVPNLYLGSNGDPLYPHCKLNDNKKFEIKCTFSKDEIKNNYFKYNGSVNVFEIISGCKGRIDSGFKIIFDYKIEHCKRQENGKCIFCQNPSNQYRYKISEDEKSCESHPFFLFMGIGMPLLSLPLLILLGAVFFFEEYSHKDRIICSFIIYALIYALLFIFTMSFYYQNKDKK